MDMIKYYVFKCGGAIQVTVLRNDRGRRKLGQVKTSPSKAEILADEGAGDARMLYYETRPRWAMGAIRITCSRMEETAQLSAAHTVFLEGQHFPKLG